MTYYTDLQRLCDAQTAQSEPEQAPLGKATDGGRAGKETSP